MGCSCKHSDAEIKQGFDDIKLLRKLFIKRMTEDSETDDRRRKDYNQAIFGFVSDDDVDVWNEDCEKFGLAKRSYGETYAVFDGIDMDMVLQCFDDAVKDWRRTFCDVKDCRRK